MALFPTAAMSAPNCETQTTRRLLRRLRVGIFALLALLALSASGAACADSLSLVSGAGQSGLGGSASAYPVVVQVRNASGSAVSGRTIYWTTSNGFVLSAASSVTDANGLASVSFTYGNYGTTGIDAVDPVGSTSARALETSVGSDSITLISGGGQAGQVGTSATQPLVVEIRNAAGNPIVGRTVGWTSQSSYTAVAAPYSLTNGSGRASMSFSYVASPPVVNIDGTPAVIRATNSASPSLESVDATVRVLGVDYIRIISARSQSGLVGSTSAPVTAQVTNWAGIPVAGASVQWADQNGKVSLSAASTVTDANGQTSITFQYVNWGDGEITASLFGGNDVEDVLAYSSVNAGSVVLISPKGMSGAPSSVSPDPIVVEVRSNNGALEAGRTVSWTLSSGDAVLDAPSTLTDSNGRASVGFTFGTVTSNVLATDTASGRGIGQSLFVVASDTLRVVSGAGQVGTAGNPAAQPLVVEVLTSTGAPIAGRTINWSQTPVEGAGVSLGTTSAITDVNGQASLSFSYLSAGRTRIIATDGVNGRNTQVTVSATGTGTLNMISGSGQSGLIGTHSAQPLVVELRDANGLVVPGRTIAWGTEYGMTPDAPSSVTDGSGRASMGFTYAATASIGTVFAEVSLYPNQQLEIDFPVTALGTNALSLISGNGQTGAQSTAGALPLTVRVLDNTGSPVVGRTINWATISGNATPSAASSLTDASGQASVGFNYGLASTSTIRAADAVTGQQVFFTVTGTSAGGTIQFISGNGQSGQPGTAGPQPIIVEIRNSSNQPSVGDAVVWSVVSGPATLGAVTTVTDANGRVSAAFNFGATAGTSIIQMKKVSGALIQATVTALAGPGDPSADTLTLMSGGGQTGLSGSASTQPIVVQVRNVNGAAVAGRSISWTASDGFTLSAASSVSDANGRASVNFTYGNTGTTVILASDSVSMATASALETSSGGDSIVLISGGGQAGKAGSTSAQPLVVELRNAAGNPIVGRTVNWADQTSSTQVNAATSVTDGSGRASMGFTYLQGPAAVGGAVGTIRATNSGDSQFVTASATVLGFDVLRLVSAASQSGLVGSAGAPITVELLDWTGTTPVPGATVTWYERLSSGLVTLSATSTVTDASGKATIGFQYAQPGTGEITAQYGPSEVDMRFVSVGSDQMTLVSVQTLYGAPSSPAPVPVTIEMRDVNNQPIANRSINWTVTLGNAVVNAATSVTDALGRATMGFTHGTVSSIITATDPLTVNANPSAPNFAGTADTYAEPTASGNSIRLVSGSGQTGLAGTAAAQPIVVEALDGAGAPIVGLSINWVKSGSALLASTTSLTNASGQASMSFTYAGPGQTMIQAANGTVGYVQAFVTATGIDTIVAISGDGQSGLVGSHSTQPLVAELRDAGGQPIAGRSINWLVNGGNAVFDAATSVTDALGRASMGFTYGPTASINGMEARDASTGVHIGFLTTAVGSNAISLISGTGQTGTQGSAGAQPLVVEVRDAAGLPVAGRSIDWTTLGGDAVLGATSSITDAAGRASMSFTYGSSTTSTIGASDSVSGQQVQFTVTATQAVRIARIVSGGDQSGLPGTAGPQPIVFEVRDGSNTPLSGQSLTWDVISGPATLGAVTTVTDANGQASAAFNFGPTPGTSLVQARDSASGQLVQAAVTALGDYQTVVEVSGNDQILAVGTPSEPMIVELRDFANAPVVGATIDWTTSNGTLANASTVTDANGQSSNTVTVTEAGTVTVEATSLLAAAPLVFTLNSSVVAALPNLTPTQESVAVAVDNSCVALTNQETLTPEEADFLARCEEITAAAGIDAAATTDALDELITDTAQAQSSAAVVAAGAQFQNIKLRQMALRSGSKTSALSNLTLTGPGGMISLGSLMSALADDELPPVEQPIYSRWGFFAAGNIGRGEADAGRTTPAYDYDIDGITAGIDYRQSDDFIFGAALGYTRQDTDLAGNQGTVEMSGTSLSAYGTYSFKEVWYLDGVITVGWNGYEMTRRLAYTLPTPGGGTTSVNQVASGDPDGDVLSGALTFGGDFHKDAFSFSPYGQMLYTRVGFDSYEETMQSGPGSGLGLAVDARTVTALTGILGSRFAYTHSTDWGVLVPTASIEWNHEFKDDENAISARFIHDPTQTLISVEGDPLDTQYFRIGIGLSMVLARGRSGFFLYDYMVGRDGQSQENFAIGIRVEF